MSSFEQEKKIAPRGPFNIVREVSSYAWKCNMKQPQRIIVTQFHLPLSRRTRSLRRAVFSGVVLFDFPRSMAHFAIGFPSFS